MFRLTRLPASQDDPPSYLRVRPKDIVAIHTYQGLGYYEIITRPNNKYAIRHPSPSAVEMAIDREGS